MSEFVVIRLAEDDSAVQWMLADSNGTALSRPASGSLEQAAVDAVDRAVIVLVPATDVLSTTVNIPARSTAKIKAALPFALEENLADDVEDLHFASGVRQENNRMPVAVVSLATLERWLDRLRDAGIDPAKIVPENHGLAKIPGTMSVLVDESGVMFNDGADDDFVLNDIKPSEMMRIAGKLGEDSEDDAEDPRHLVVFCTPEQEEDLSEDWAELRQAMHSVDVNVLADGVLPKLAITVAAGHGINLLQGRFGRQTEYATLFKPWRVAAMLFLGLIVAAMALKGVTYYRLLEDESMLRAQFTAEYRLIRPDDTREIVDPVSTVESLRRSVGSSAAPQVFLPSMLELAQAIAANSGAEVEAISYRAGVIDLRLTAPDVATLDNIQSAVSSSGRFQASIQSTDQVADRIQGRIQIRETGS